MLHPFPCRKKLYGVGALHQPMCSSFSVFISLGECADRALSMNQLPSSVTSFHFLFVHRRKIGFIGKAAFSDDYYI